jgi:phenylalanyl-tRNA synthetase beta chain
MAMIVNTAWLREYLEPACTHEELVDVLPRIGLELERLCELRADLSPVRTGFIRKKESIPGHDGYHLCQIEIAKGKTISVVCASVHEVKEGWGVPVAPAGTTLPTGGTIRSETVHGRKSEGMICLDGELGLLAKGSGLQYTTDESLLGKSVAEAFDVSEFLLELNVLANRPDFLGLVGIAREVAAALRLKLRYPKTIVPTTGTPVVPVEIKDPSLCSRYMGGLVRGVKVESSPAWFKSRLLLAGMRPINNVVDITNYVLYEYGQPLHAFDFDTLAEGRIVVRRMTKGESFELLSGKSLSAEGQDKEIRFAQPPLVIADGKKPVALAGIMGGKATQTTAATKNVFIEVAHFDPVNIRKTAKEVDLGIDRRGTDSSYRFERGTDPNLMLEGALARAMQLVVELAGGTATDAISDVYPSPRTPKVFKLSEEKTASYLGMPVDLPTISDCLSRLAMKCEATSKTELAALVPTWRVDVNDPVVLIEDVARLVGYDKIPGTPKPAAPSRGVRSPLDQLKQNVSNHLVSAGYFESRTPPLEGPNQTEWLGEPHDEVTVVNFATREMSVLRRTLLPGLAATVQNNIRRGAAAVQFFEVDRAFTKTPSSETPSGAWRVAGMAGGQLDESNWRAANAQIDFYTVKGTLEDLFDRLGIEGVTFKAADQPPYVLGATAEIMAGGKKIGYVGEVDADALKIERLTFKLYGFELELESFVELASILPAYHPLYRQPAVVRDLAIVIPMDQVYSEIESTIREKSGSRLESLQLVDRYQGSQVAAGHQSIAFRLIFRDPEVTLTTDQVSDIVGGVVAELEKRFGAQLRA